MRSWARCPTLGPLSATVGFVGPRWANWATTWATANTDTPLTGRIKRYPIETTSTHAGHGLLTLLLTSLILVRESLTLQNRSPDRSIRASRRTRATGLHPRCRENSRTVHNQSPAGRWIHSVCMPRCTLPNGPFHVSKSWGRSRRLLVSTLIIHTANEK
jgi:hypothetical protein